MGSNDGQFPQGNSPLPPPNLPPPSVPGQPTVPAAQYAPMGQPSPTPGKKKGLMIGLVVAAVVAVGVAAVLVLGGDDSPSAEPTTTPEPSTTATVPVTEPPATLPVLTAPEPTEPAVEEVAFPWAESEEMQVWIDDENVFQIAVPVEWEASTEAREIFGASGVGISAAPDLAGYRDNDDDVGATAAVMYSSDVGGAFGLLTSFVDAVSVCAENERQSGYETTSGPVELVLFDGCGTGGMYAKAVVALDVGSTTVMVIGQGPGPAGGDVLTMVELILQSFMFQP